MRFLYFKAFIQLQKGPKTPTNLLIFLTIPFVGEFFTKGNQHFQFLVSVSNLLIYIMTYILSPKNDDFRRVSVYILGKLKQKFRISKTAQCKLVLGNLNATVAVCRFLICENRLSFLHLIILYSTKTFTPMQNMYCLQCFCL